MMMILPTTMECFGRDVMKILCNIGICTEKKNINMVE